MGIENTRRDQLVRAAIEEIGTAGNANVTVGQIAKRAGVSSALAFHYFGDKEQLFLSAMRHILRDYQDAVRGGLSGNHNPRHRLEAIIAASFAEPNFQPTVVSAWLVFYVHAQHNPQAARLLRVYRQRLHSTLLYDLRRLNAPKPDHLAEALGALIDGLYIRHALAAQDPEQAEALVIETLTHGLSSEAGQ